MMLSHSTSLFQRCHINTNSGDDRFVGIKVSDGKPHVHFPIGYFIPENEKNVRTEILSLLGVLERYGLTGGELRGKPSENKIIKATFPFYACLGLIRDYMQRGGYFTEREHIYKEGCYGKIHWPRTIKTEKPIISTSQVPIYTQYKVRYTPPTEKKLITQIHKFCVYKSFCLLGWLYTSFIPERPNIEFNKSLFLAAIRKKALELNNDRDKYLMHLLKLFVEDSDILSSSTNAIFGTMNFEYVWEKIIDKIFGVSNKNDFFPRTQWNLKYGDQKNNYPLEPDSIMIFNGNYYILDAKYYKYGITGNPFDLPESSSINKQITYGEFIAKKYCQKTEEKSLSVMNAFLMPFNSSSNPFGLSANFENIGEATGLWKNNQTNRYERIQGILIDTRFLIHKALSMGKTAIPELAAAIEDEFKKTTSSVVES